MDNLNHLVSEKILACPNHSTKDENYINIGDQTLIESRNRRQIPVNPGGYFEDYVAFYFGNRPPMLYNIQKGFKNATKRNPCEIVYLVTTLSTVKQAGLSFVFTDGHAYHNFTQFFNQENDLKHVDWNAVNLKRWDETEDDPDRKRRKQAECLIYKELPLKLIKAIIVYDETAKSKILSIFKQYDFDCDVLIKPKWYY
jgi:hypothetical protein